MTGRRPTPAGMAGLVGLALVGACAQLPDPPTRLLAVTPEGVVAPGAVVAELTFSAPVSAEGIVDGRRVALCREADAAGVAALASGEAGLGPGAPVIDVRIRIEDGGRRARIESGRPLWPMAAWAVVVGKGLRDAGGQPVLDASGRQRATAHRFETGDLAAGALPAAVLTEALARAAAPQAGGEYAEVWNAGTAVADLAGFHLAKRTASGVQRCAIEPGPPGGAAVIPPRGRGLLAGGSWDGRYPLPAGTAVYRCGTAALLGGLADDRPVALALESPGGRLLSSLGWEEPAPICADGPVARVDAAGPDAAANLACAGAATPGW